MTRKFAEHSLMRGLTLVTLAVLISTAGPALAQPAFEVASVKPNKMSSAAGEKGARESIESGPGSLTMRNVSLRACIRWAYGANDYQISGPGWLAAERYDIVAKAPDAASTDQLRLMLRALLAERFKLTLHRETKDLPVYALVIGKNGPKLQDAKAAGPSSMRPGAVEGGIGFRNFSMQDLADSLSTRPFGVDRPVLDKTGIKGVFDFALQLAESNADMKRGLERAGGQDPSIYMSGLQEIGLKLESQKGPIEILVIDAVEKVPTEN